MMNILSLNHDKKAILKRVASRTPYAAHIGQRLLFGWAWHRGEAPKLLEALMVLCGFISLFGGLWVARIMLIGGGRDADDERYGVMVVVALTATCLATYFWARRTSTLITLEQTNDMHRWMTAYPQLAEAASHWITGRDVLRARDHRLMGWAVGKLEKLEKLATCAQTALAFGGAQMVKGEAWWAMIVEQHKDAIQNWKTLPGVSAFPNDVTSAEHQALSKMVDKTAQLAEVKSATYHNRHRIIQMLIELGGTERLRVKGFDSLITDFSGLAAIGVLLILTLGFGCVSAWAMISHGFDMSVYLDTVKWAGSDPRVVLLSATAGGLLVYAMAWMYFNVRPLNKAELEMMSEVLTDHPLVREAFVRELEDTTILRVRHLLGVLQARNVMTDVQRGRQERLHSQTLAASLAHLPAAQIAAARAQQAELKQSVGGNNTANSRPKKM